jgi:hypothetical protein
MDEKGFKSGNKLSGQVVTGRAYFAPTLRSALRSSTPVPARFRGSRAVTEVYSRPVERAASGVSL